MEIKNLEEAQKVIFDVLIQGDSRYINPQEEFRLAHFLLNGAILLEKIEAADIPEPKNNNLGIQADEKYFAKEMLKKEGFNEGEISFETMFRGSRVDILARSKNKIILVECCSCRVDKIRDYLIESNSEVWIVIRDELPWMNEKKDKSYFFIFKRGNNWNLVEKFEKNKLEELKKIKSPLDF